MRELIAENLDRAIHESRRTNRSVGEAIGSTEHQVWRWRRGKVRPSDENLAALADELGREFAWFFVDHQRAAA